MLSIKSILMNHAKNRVFKIQFVAKSNNQIEQSNNLVYAALPQPNLTFS